MITLYDEQDQIIKTLSSYEYTESDMGESSISATVLFKDDVPFHPDWYVLYNGEKFKLGTRKPTGRKDTSSLSTSYTLTFSSELSYLKRYTFMDYVELGTNNPQPSSFKVHLNCTLTEFVYRFNLNLHHYIDNSWEMTLPADYIESGERVVVSFDNVSLWDVLIKVYEVFKVRWVYSNHIIKVAWQPQEIQHIFEYGKDNGLVSIERNNNTEAIVTRLRGRGGSRNLPANYFHSGDPDTNSVLQNVFYAELMPKSYRDYVRGYNAGSGSGTPAYNQGVADKVAGKPISPIDYVISDKEDLWGVRYGAIEANEKIYPTLQGVEDSELGRLDEVVAVEAVYADAPVDVDGRIINLPSSKSTVTGRDGIQYYRGEIAGGIPDVSPNGSAVDTTVISTVTLESTDSLNKLSLNLRYDATYYDAEGNNIPAVDYFEIERLIRITNVDTGASLGTFTESSVELLNIPIGTYRIEGVVSLYSSNRTQSLVVCNVDCQITGKLYTYSSVSQQQGFKETFDIDIKDVWGIPRESGESDEDYSYRVWSPLAVTEEMTVMFSDGLLAGEDYEFRIVGFSINSDNLRSVIASAIKPISGGWRLTLQKSDAELNASGRYLPNSIQNATSGDHFFFVNIAMPYDPYVYNAELRVEEWLESQLALTDEEFPTFTISPSRIFCKNFNEVDKIKVGNTIKLRNTSLVGESDIVLHIQSVTKRYTDALNPDWNITVSDNVVATGNPLSLLSGDIDVLSSQISSTQQSSKYILETLSSIALRKDGVADTSKSPTTFLETITFVKDILQAGFIPGSITGSGAGIYSNEAGESVVEADIIVGRKGAQFNDIVVNQTTFTGGKQVFSAAGIIVSNVESTDNGYKCYFDNKQGSLRNKFITGDGIFSERFMDGNFYSYWGRVISIGSDWIEISTNGSAPSVGDSIVQLGHQTDTSRQSAFVIDVVRDGGGLVSWYDNITEFSLEDKDSVHIGKIDDKVWLKVFGSAYIGDKDENQYVKYTDGILRVKGVLEVGSEFGGTTVVDGGLIQSSVLSLGYMDGENFMVMSGTNGVYDDGLLGGGIASWWGGDKLDLADYYQWDGQQWVPKVDIVIPDRISTGLIRFDGTGYFANGAFWWDSDGTIYADPTALLLSLDSDVGDETLSQVLLDIRSNLSSLIDIIGIDALGNVYIKPKSDGSNRDFYAYGNVSAFGYHEDSDLSIGLLTDWSQEAGEDDALGALLGKELNNRVSALERGGGGGGATTLGGLTNVDANADSVPATTKILVKLSGSNTWTLKDISEIGGGSGGGITESELASYLTNNNYAKKSDIPSLSGYATQTWVQQQGYLTTISSLQVTTALGYTPVNPSSLKSLTIKRNNTTLSTYSPTSGDSSVNIIVPTTASDVGALPATTKYAASNSVGGDANNSLKLGGAALNEIFTSLTSGTTDAVKMTIGGVSKSISKTTLLSSLGLSNLDSRFDAKLDKATFNELFEVVRNNDNSIAYIKAKSSLVSVANIVAYWSDDSGTGSEDSISLESLSDVLISSPTNGQALVWNGNKWVNSTIETGLNTTELENYLSTRYVKTTTLSSQLTNYVQKVSGKGLSTNDFTNTYKTKLDGLENYNDSELRNLINGKQATITGAASTITSSNLTADRVLVSDSSGKVAISAITSTELGYLGNLTTNVQSHITKFSDMFQLVTSGGVTYVKTKYNFVSEGNVVAYSDSLNTTDAIGSVIMGRINYIPSSSNDTSFYTILKGSATVVWNNTNKIITITHNIGHTNYMVFCSGLTDEGEHFSFGIYKEENQVIIYAKGDMSDKIVCYDFLIIRNDI